MEIAKLMLKEHGIILGLMNEFKKTKSEASFEKMRAKQENPVFAEERAIFMLDKDGKRFPEILTILSQHEGLEKVVSEIKEKIIKAQNASVETEILVGLMKAHIQFEDKNFYPKLDKKLDNSEKEEVLKKINDVIIGSIRL